MRENIIYFVGLLIIISPLLYASAFPFSSGYSLATAIGVSAVGAAVVVTSFIFRYKGSHQQNADIVR